MYFTDYLCQQWLCVSFVHYGPQIDHDSGMTRAKSALMDKFGLFSLFPGGLFLEKVLKNKLQSLTDNIINIKKY